MSTGELIFWGVSIAICGIGAGAGIMQLVYRSRKKNACEEVLESYWRIPENNYVNPDGRNPINMMNDFLELMIDKKVSFDDLVKYSRKNNPHISLKFKTFQEALNFAYNLIVEAGETALLNISKRADVSLATLDDAFREFETYLAWASAKSGYERQYSAFHIGDLPLSRKDYETFKKNMYAESAKYQYKTLQNWKELTPKGLNPFKERMFQDIDKCGLEATGISEAELRDLLASLAVHEVSALVAA